MTDSSGNTGNVIPAFNFCYYVLLQVLHLYNVLPNVLRMVLLKMSCTESLIVTRCSANGPAFAGHYV
jgi:hypothetical protein